jgi:hypothetical protein
MALSINGMQSSSTGGNTLTVASGNCRDSADTVTITIPNGETRTVNVTVSGVGGIVGGSVQANTSYALYVGLKTADNSVACALSTNFSLTVSGYKLRRIGAVLTNGSSQVVAFTQTGSSNARQTAYDATPSVLTVVNSQSSSTWQAFDLSPPMPQTGNGPSARLDVTPVAGMTWLSSDPPDLAIGVNEPTVLGFTPPLDSYKGSFKTGPGASTTITITGFSENV